MVKQNNYPYGAQQYDIESGGKKYSFNGIEACACSGKKTSEDAQLKKQSGSCNSGNHYSVYNSFGNDRSQ